MEDDYAIKSNLSEEGKEEDMMILPAVVDPPPSTPLNPNQPLSTPTLPPKPISHRRKYAKHVEEIMKEKEKNDKSDKNDKETFKLAKKRALIDSSEHDLLRYRPPTPTPTPFHPTMPTMFDKTFATALDRGRKLAQYEMRERQINRLVLQLSHIVSEYMALTPALIDAVLKIQGAMDEPLIGGGVETQK